jgi:hypothetical protein
MTLESRITPNTEDSTVAFGDAVLDILHKPFIQYCSGAASLRQCD